MYNNFIKKFKEPMNKKECTLGDLLVKTSKDNGSYPTENSSRKSNDENYTEESTSNSNNSYHNYNLLKNSILKEFHFTKDDLMIIAYLYTLYIEEYKTIPVIQLLKNLFGNNSKALINSNHLARLAKDGIITVVKPGVPRLSCPIGMLFDFNDLEEEIIHGYGAYLSKPFINFIIDEQPPVLIDDGYNTNSKFLQDTFYCCLLAKRYTNVPNDQWRIDLYDSRVNQKYDNIRKRLNNTKIDIPFVALEKKHKLTKYEQLTIWHLIERESNQLKSDPGMLSRVIENDKYSRNKINSILSENEKLFKNELIEITNVRTYNGLKTNITINPDIYNYVVKNSNNNDSTSPLSLIKSNSTIQLLTPKRSMRDLILSDNKKKIINSIIKSSSSNTIQKLARWGLVDSIETEDQTIFLLYGLPGTGKTLSAEVIAFELNKDLMIVDISQIKDKWIGGSEKNLKNVFNTYYDYFNRVENPPILLLNECDQFLSRRIENILQHSDQMMNTMQNMLLEFFENFKGICIATTNLVSNLDPAFSRRFTHKIELTLPEYNERVKLWQLLIPKKLPIASCVNIENLANKYSFTGSQIRTVILNTATDVANRNEVVEIVTQDDFMAFADMEKMGSFDNSSPNNIGFNN